MMNATPLVLTPDQVRAFDRFAIETLGLPGIVLMENAGRNAAEIIDGFMGERSCNSALIVCGTGNNGGDGFVIARHLLNRGRVVRTALVGDPRRMSTDCKINHDIARAMKLPIDVITTPAETATLCTAVNLNTVVVDALLGTGFCGPVREPVATTIRLIQDNASAGVVAVDVPSGLNAATGQVESVSIQADVTITFVALKTGFLQKNAVPLLGNVQVVDIGVASHWAGRMRGGADGLFNGAY